MAGKSYDRTVNITNAIIGAPSKPTLTATPRVYGNSVDLLGTVAADNGAVISQWEVRFASTLAALGCGIVVRHRRRRRQHAEPPDYESDSRLDLLLRGPRHERDWHLGGFSDSASATVSTVATYFGHGVGSSANPYRIAPSDFLVARNIKT